MQDYKPLNSLNFIECLKAIKPFHQIKYLTIVTLKHAVIGAAP